MQCKWKEKTFSLILGFVKLCGWDEGKCVYIEQLWCVLPIHSLSWTTTDSYQKDLTEIFSPQVPTCGNVAVETVYSWRVCSRVTPVGLFPDLTVSFLIIYSLRDFHMIDINGSHCLLYSTQPGEATQYLAALRDEFAYPHKYNTSLVLFQGLGIKLPSISVVKIWIIHTLPPISQWDGLRIVQRQMFSSSSEIKSCETSSAEP